MTLLHRFRKRRFIVAAAVATAVLPALAATPAMATAAPAGPSQASAANYKHACPLGKPGTMACMALIRTDIHGAGIRLAGPSPNGYTPADLAAAYHLNTVGGTGQTVAIVDAYDDPNAASDLAVYRSQFGLPPCTTANGCFQELNQEGAASPLPNLPPPVLSGWGTETSLDLDMVSAACPNCHILLVETNSQSNQDLFDGVDVATERAKFVSDSWAFPEYRGETNDDVHFNHPGTVIAFASGDYGHDGGVFYPAASQYVVAVGGTSLFRGSGGTFTEQAWGGSGSGCSAFEPEPGWQLGPPDTHCGNRAVADVSAVADINTGVSIYDTIDDTGWDVSGGTSAATPIITAVYALAGPPLATDPAAFLLYRHFIGRGPTVVPPEQVLNDVTTGSTGDCGAPVCDARAGWDGPTGVGTPIGTGAFVRPFAFGAIVTDDQSGAVGTAVSLTVQGRDGVTPYVWTADGLPPGLSIDSPSGLISGTPTAAGTYQVTVTGHDSA
ncbi:MAG TPA: putative Ig domain-containing protein, partial [Streptosporangiaceae bacterium]|nr:putative Ig domain-containing protein [Streptosporangiaceae bacterium]